MFRCHVTKDADDGAASRSDSALKSSGESRSKAAQSSSRMASPLSVKLFLSCSKKIKSTPQGSNATKTSECFKLERMQCNKTVQIIQKATSNDMNDIPQALIDYMVESTFQPAKWCNARELSDWVVTQLRDRMSTEEIWVVLKVYRLVHQLLWSGSLCFAEALQNSRSSFFQYGFFKQISASNDDCEVQKSLVDGGLTAPSSDVPTHPPSKDIATAESCGLSTISSFDSSRVTVSLLCTESKAPGSTPLDMPCKTTACRNEKERSRDFVFNFLGYLESLCEYRVRHPDLQPNEMFSTKKSENPQRRVSSIMLRPSSLLVLPRDRKDLYTLAMDTLELIKCTAAADIHLKLALQAPMMQQLMQHRLQDLFVFVRLLQSIVCETLQMTVMDFLEASGGTNCGVAFSPSCTYDLDAANRTLDGGTCRESLDSTRKESAGPSPVAATSDQSFPPLTRRSSTLTKTAAPTPARTASSHSSSEVSRPDRNNSSLQSQSSSLSVFGEALLHDWYRLLYQLERTMRQLKSFFQDVSTITSLETIQPRLFLIDPGVITELKQQLANVSKSNSAMQHNSTDSTSAVSPRCDTREPAIPSSHPFSLSRWKQLWASQVNVVMDFAHETNTKQLIVLAKALGGAEEADPPAGSDSVLRAGRGSTCYKDPESLGSGFIPTFSPQSPQGGAEEPLDKLSFSPISPYALTSSGSRMTSLSKPTSSDIAHHSTVMVIRQDGTYHSIAEKVSAEETDALDESLRQLLEKDDVVVVCNEPCSCNDELNLADRFQVFHDMPLGSGTFGHVYRAWDNQVGSYLAAKEVPLKLFSRATPPAVEGAESPVMGEALREFTVLTALDHPRIVRVVAFMIKGKVGCIFMEWMPAGSLLEVLHHPQTAGGREGLDERLVRRYAMETLEGLAYLHSRRVLHRDIKPANLLLGPDGSVKLTDFGTSHVFNEENGTTLQTANISGTVAYLSPEAVKGVYSPSSDIWALGCTVLELTSACPPWCDPVTHHHPGNIPLLFKIGSLNDDSRMERPHTAWMQTEAGQRASPELLDFLNQIFITDRKRRPTAEELLQHAFLRQGDTPAGVQYSSSLSFSHTSSDAAPAHLPTPPVAAATIG